MTLAFLLKPFLLQESRNDWNMEVGMIVIAILLVWTVSIIGWFLESLECIVSRKGNIVRICEMRHKYTFLFRCCVFPFIVLAGGIYAERIGLAITVLCCAAAVSVIMGVAAFALRKELWTCFSIESPSYLTSCMRLGAGIALIANDHKALYVRCSDQESKQLRTLLDLEKCDLPDNAPVDLNRIARGERIGDCTATEFYDV